MPLIHILTRVAKTLLLMDGSMGDGRRSPAISGDCTDGLARRSLDAVPWHGASGNRNVPLYAGRSLLAAQVVGILVAFFIPERFFCWAPFDEATRYAIRVRIGDRLLSQGEIQERYASPTPGYFPRGIASLQSVIRQYEQTRGAADHARVIMAYTRNGRPPEIWTWPAR